MNRTIYCLIPASNHDNTIGAVVADVLMHLSTVLVIDDGSIDDTAEVARKAGARVITYKHGRGRAGSLKAGLAYCLEHGAQGVITMAPDGSDDPASIPQFIEAFETGLGDVILGSYLHEANNLPFGARLSGKLTAALSKFYAGQRVEDAACLYKLISRKALEQQLKSTGVEVDFELLIRASRIGLKLHSIPLALPEGSPLPVKRSLFASWGMMRRAHGASR